MTGEKPYIWSKWLMLVEYWYNTNFLTVTQATPYEIVYGQPPPVHLPYLPGESKIQVVARSLEERENMILILKFYLTRAQHCMKQQGYLHRSERPFEVGEFVYVKLYRQQSVVVRAHQKIAPKYYSPYKVLDRHGSVAYKLELHVGSQVHPVFHVSQLKKSVGDVSTATKLPSIRREVEDKKPDYVLGRKMVQRHNRPATMIW